MLLSHVFLDEFRDFGEFWSLPGRVCFPILTKP